MATQVLSRRPKPFGAKLTGTKFRASCSLTKWTKPALTLQLREDDQRPYRHKCCADRSADWRRDQLEGVIDLVTMEEWVYQGEDLGASWIRQPIRAELQTRRPNGATPCSKLLLSKMWLTYLEGNEPGGLRELIRKGTLSLAFVPLWRARRSEQGVSALNAVIDYLPSPLDVPAYIDFKPGDETGP